MISVCDRCGEVNWMDRPNLEHIQGHGMYRRFWEKSPTEGYYQLHMTQKECLQNEYEKYKKRILWKERMTEEEREIFEFKIRKTLEESLQEDRERLKKIQKKL